MNRQAYDALIEELACEGKFDTSTENVSEFEHNVVDENYVYKPENILFVIYSKIIRFILATVGPIFTFFAYHLKVEGRQNLKGVKKAITVSNHVLETDILINRLAAFGHKQYVTGASFNNKKGFFGYTLKAGGLLPLGESFKAQKNLVKVIEEVVENNGYVHFYAEQSLWNRYERSRPFKIGAFHFAAKLNVPVIPITFVFREPPKIMRWYRKKKFVTAIIGKPVYPDSEPTLKDQEQVLLAKVQKQYDDTIISFYGYDKETYTYNSKPKKEKDI